MNIKGFKDANGNISKYDINALGVPFTAEVGQILSVKKIDNQGKPIEWEVISFDGIKYENIILKDKTTGSLYRLTVVDGELTMSKEVIEW